MTAQLESSASSASGSSRAADAGDRLLARWSVVGPFVLVGSVCIVAGGLVAAVSRPTGFELGSWLAAYLVLVGGVAQIALGGGQAWLADSPPAALAVRSELATWNAGVLTTVVGTLTGRPVVTTFGGAASIVALALFLAGVRRAGSAPAWARLLYRSVAAIVLISTPVGLALAWIRHG
jgi:hypothetical protein